MPGTRHHRLGICIVNLGEHCSYVLHTFDYVLRASVSLILKALTSGKFTTRLKSAALRTRLTYLAHCSAALAWILGSGADVSLYYGGFQHLPRISCNRHEFLLMSCTVVRAKRNRYRATDVRQRKMMLKPAGQLVGKGDEVV